MKYKNIKKYKNIIYIKYIYNNYNYNHDNYYIVNIRVVIRLQGNTMMNKLL